jgi:hypothetical protein
LRAGDRVHATVALHAAQPSFVRFALQSAEFVWSRALQEVRFRDAETTEEVALDLALSRDVDFCQLTVERLAGSSDDRVELAISSISLKFTGADGSAGDVHIAPRNVVAMGYGALSAIGPPESRTQPRSSPLTLSEQQPSASSPLPLAPELGDENRALQRPKSRIVRPRYRLEPMDGSSYLLTRIATNASNTANDLHLVRVEIADRKVASVFFPSAGHNADRRVLASEGDSTFCIAVPDGRRNLIDLLTHPQKSATIVDVLSKQTKALAEELVCYWEHVEQLARDVEETSGSRTSN